MQIKCFLRILNKWLLIIIVKFEIWIFFNKKYVIFLYKRDN